MIRQATGSGRGRLTAVSKLERITVDPSICHGKPTVRGLRYPVESLLELLASGMTIEEIIEDHPDLDGTIFWPRSSSGRWCRSAPGAARRCVKFLST